MPDDVVQLMHKFTVAVDCHPPGYRIEHYGVCFKPSPLFVGIRYEIQKKGLHMYSKVVVL